MYVVEIIPIGRGMTADTLSYFSSVSYPRGTLLTIPLRGGNSLGMVSDMTEVSGVKTALRAATFTLRKLAAQEHTTALTYETLTTIERAARYHASSIGSMLFALLPKEIKSGILPSVTDAEKGVYAPSPHTPSSPELFQASAEDRFIDYVSLVRQAFAERSSVLLIVPTIEHVHQASLALQGGIEKHVVTVSSQSGARALKSAYARIAQSEHPLLIVATPQYALIDRSDIRTTIVEHSRSHGYTGHSRPYVDFRRAIIEHSTLHKRRVILGDTLVRSEEEYALREGVMTPHTEHPKRLELRGKVRVVEMHKDPDGTKAFTLFSPELITYTERVLKEKEHVFLFNARRGLAPVVACVDCGHILRSPESGAPLSLHRRVRDGVEERWLVCGVSGYRERARDVCPICGSWRLRERGIGIQHAYDELRPLFPDTPIILFDNTTADTPKKATALKETFYGTKGGILLGTALALPYISTPVALSCVISTDSLKAIPSWRQQEEALGILLTIREKTDGLVLVQTRTEADELIEYAAAGTTRAFFDAELALRERYHYPPYATFIHLTWQGNALGVRSLGSTIDELFAPYNITLYGAPGEEETETTTRHGLMRVKSSEWPHDDIILRLRTLPPSVRIMINPDRIV